MFIWKATFIDFEENYHAYVYMRPTFIQHSRVVVRYINVNTHSCK